MKAELRKENDGRLLLAVSASVIEAGLERKLELCVRLQEGQDYEFLRKALKRMGADVSDDAVVLHGGG